MKLLAPAMLAAVLLVAAHIGEEDQAMPETPELDAFAAR
jgi:hypothetical protein